MASYLAEKSVKDAPTQQEEPSIKVGGNSIEGSRLAENTERHSTGSLWWTTATVEGQLLSSTKDTSARSFTYFDFGCTTVHTIRHYSNECLSSTPIRLLRGQPYLDIISSKGIVVHGLLETTHEHITSFTRTDSCGWDQPLEIKSMQSQECYSPVSKVSLTESAILWQSGSGEIPVRNFIPAKMKSLS